MKKWACVDSNHGPSACKAGTLNQLSYKPLLCGKDRLFILSNRYPPQIFQNFNAQKSNNKPYFLLYTTLKCLRQGYYTLIDLLFCEMA